MNIKISVIVPVYNTEKYLKKCLDSILNQTFKEFELIVVNDGSTDESLDILKNYEAKYDNIIVINKQNEGQGVARNKALEICRGEYIAFADSDDYVEPNMLELMYTKSNENNLDVVICSYKCVNSNGDRVIDNNIILKDEEVINNVECIKRFLVTDTIEGFSWNKLFKRKVFNDIKYPEDMKYEDIPTVVSLLINSDRIGFINKELYNYLIRDNSTTATQTIKNTQDYVKSIYMVGEILKNKYINNLEKEYEYYHSKKIISSILEFFKTNENKKENRELGIYIKKYVSTINKYKILFSNNYFKKIEALKIIVKIYLYYIYMKVNKKYRGKM